MEEEVYKRTPISIDQILEPLDKQDSVRLVLIEGAPGIGKSTLAWELCRKWDELSVMKQYSLVVLLRLREERVQQITQVSDLFFPFEDRKNLADEVIGCHGKGVLFVMDGFDELTVKQQSGNSLLGLHSKNDSMYFIPKVCSV